MTHTGNVTYGDYGNVTGKTKRVELRQTKNFWVDIYGLKFRKSDGSVVGVRSAFVTLDLNSIKPKSE